MLNTKEILEAIEERLEIVDRELDRTQEIAPNSYGAGYETGTKETLLELKKQILEEVE